MINKEYVFYQTSTTFSKENIFVFIFFFKSFLLISYLNCKIFFLLQTSNFFYYYPTFIENNYSFNSFLSNKDDAFFFLSLYSEKFFLFFYLAFLFFYGMIGVILITDKNHV